ncbi:hypothetical protein IM157_01075 [Staphylococcus epidermidis]|nr:hypothetical protein [Staphylococcus epidermidis]
MTNHIDTLIALSKEYIRLLEKRKKDKSAYSYEDISDARLIRTGLVLRQTMIEFEKGRMKYND